MKRVRQLYIFKYDRGTPDAEVLICTPDEQLHTPLLPSLITNGNVDVIASDKVADINGDGSMDLFDALLLAQHFG